MTNPLNIFRSLLIYGLCLPLAVYVGYVLAQPLDRGSLIFLIVATALPLVPFLLRWHHVLLIFSWNLSLVLFFLPGTPYLWMLMGGLSLGLTTLQYVLKRNVKFVYVPSVAWALIFLAGVVLITAQLTGGFGMRSLGNSDSMGGKRYFYLLLAIIGYFALTSYRIPANRTNLYVFLFFVGGVAALIGSFGPWIPGSLRIIFAFFPVESLASQAEAEAQELSRFGGLSLGGMSLLYLILARHGMAGLFNLSERWRFLPASFKDGPSLNQPWRFLMLPSIGVAVMMGGFRSHIIMLLLLFTCLFYLERLFRTRLLPMLLLTGVLTATVCLPFVDKMPLSFQRSLSFLPLNNISPLARINADSSTEWRLKIWREVIPTIPQYLLIGKGYSMDVKDQAAVEQTQEFRGSDGEGAKIAGDYHNGPLSVIIPFGIFGVIGFVWFLVAGFRVLLNNYRYGEPAHRQINTFLLAYFCTRVIIFFVVFGSIYVELVTFIGLVGMGLSVNGVVRRPVPVATTPNPAYLPFRLPKTAKV